MNKIIDFIKKIVTWERMRYTLYGQIIIGIFIIIFGFIEIFYGLKILNFTNVLDILKIIIWPITVIFISLFFRKILAYFFFSLEEFNFFGNKGRLKNPTDLIKEKVQDELRKNQETQKTQDQISSYENKIKALKTDSLLKEYTKEKKYKILLNDYVEFLKNTYKALEKTKKITNGNNELKI